MILSPPRVSEDRLPLLPVVQPIRRRKVSDDGLNAAGYRFDRIVRLGLAGRVRAGWKPRPRYVQVTVLDHHQMAADFDEYSRLQVPVIPLDRRTGVAEVETGYTEEQARREASRCLQCWVNTIFDGNEAEGTECILCGGCVDVCPENCLQLVPLSQVRFSEETQGRLAAEAGFHQGTLQHLEAQEVTAGEGSVMVKDETICIRCGLCAERCPAHTITMEAFEVFDRDPKIIPVEKIIGRK